MFKDKMNCFNPRTFLSLFAVSTCEGCPYHGRDRVIPFGSVWIYSFHVEAECLKETIPTEKLFLKSPKVKLFMKEMILVPNRCYLMLDNWENERTLQDLEFLASFDLDIMILSR